MPRKPQNRPRINRQEARDPESLGAWMLRFLEWMQVQRYSEFTIRTRQQGLAQFLEWCQEHSLSRPVEVTRPVLERYQGYLFNYRKKNGHPITATTQRGRMRPVMAFSKWLAKENVILFNPAAELELPRHENRIPNVLTPEEAEAVLATVEVDDPWGMRDRAILETFYSTGIRRLEMIHLRVLDVDLESGTLLVRQGKGKKDRLLPLGERAGAWISKYLEEVRPMLLAGPDPGALFLTIQGRVFSPDAMTALAKRYHKRAGVEKKRAACHILRHTMATAMLDHGADVRYVQEMLGHAKLDTTQIYTRVSIQKLKAVHAATHPGAKLTQREASQEAPGAEILAPEGKGSKPGPGEV